MSFNLSLLFGNIDSDGKIDNDDLDDSLRDTFENVDQSALSHLLGSSLSIGDDDDKTENSEDTSTTAEAVKHDSSAIDYSDFNELVDDDTQNSKSKIGASSSSSSSNFLNIGGKTLNSVTPKFHSSLYKSSIMEEDEEDYDEVDNKKTEIKEFVEPKKEETTEPEKTENNKTITGVPVSTEIKTEIPQIKAEKPSIKTFYPEFEKDKILKFSELFAVRKPTIVKPVKKELRVTVMDEFYEVEPDDRIILRQPLVPLQLLKKELEQQNINGELSENKSDTSSTDSEDEEDENHYSEYESDESSNDAFVNEEEQPIQIYTGNFRPIVLDDWEKSIIWSDTNSESEQDLPDSKIEKKTLMEDYSVRNSNLEKGNWVDSIIWTEHDKMKLPLVSNEKVIDQYIPEIRPPEKPKLQGYMEKKFRKISFVPKKNTDKFNISNDYYYDSQLFKNKSGRVRQQLGQAVIQHSLPALRLQHPYFKTQLPLKELRSFHRPSLKFEVNKPIIFSRVRNGKKKKIKAKDGTPMKSTKDITLKDNSKYLLLEYSEEYPPIIQNVGMASLISNYYRKVDDHDTFSPECDNGAPYILEPVDSSPFLGFGDAKSGQTIQCIHNNLFKAPIFQQNVRSTDYLVIRHTYKNEVKYYIRTLPYLYVVGQTYPVAEVPGPNSRKVTSVIRGRLQMAAYRLMRNDPLKRIRYDKLRQQFPELLERDFRLRLKEFAQLQKKGTNDGWWKLKPSSITDESSLLQLVTPEQVCLHESMLVGQQRLEDAGYAQNEIINELDDGESSLDIEIQLAPWITTKNFVLATQGKGMLKLHGPGDPTGREEGFSFIRASMKEMFFRANENVEELLALMEQRPKSYHKFSIAEQQIVYKSEIDRIWTNQLNALTSTEEPTLSEDENDEYEERNKNADETRKKNEIKEEDERRKGFGADRSHPSSPSIYYSAGSPQLNSENNNYSDMEDDSISNAGSAVSNVNKNRILYIRRTVKCSNGGTEVRVETVKDPRVINAYLRQRKLIDKQNEEFFQTNDEDKKQEKKRRTQDHVSKLKQKNKEKKESKPRARKENICSRCGQVGHTKTSRACPFWNEDVGSSEKPVENPHSMKISIPLHK
ncbi:hypothetical protein BCR36DRAFT_361137 [Piromyces finnis]|uniref:Transcription initiation factor TFIID subunit 1 histone acetyltransferase domain-containing protein n=1 Tax=Piromyces finnis TaxID=1754191 RepID=A0A1Y1UYD4_9FUNG|nr:hypothetical protein BCR36DRAFT_361137 [Piromyces finnis]|eukprot:ORX43423.1 hypothetical protein BCR36DRAFT_361137 [Piromyces finnis]